MSRNLQTLTKLALLAGLFFFGACDCGSGTPPPTDLDMGEDADMDMTILDADISTEDMDASLPDMDAMMPPDQGADMDASMADLGTDMGIDMDPGVSSCPADLTQSCIFPVLSCFGGSSNVVECFENEFTGWTEARFATGNYGLYRQVTQQGELRQQFRAVDDEQMACYQATAQEEGSSPQSWRIQSLEDRIYLLELTATESRLTCPNGSEEVCSRQRFDLFFAFPSTPPVGCEIAGAMDSCAFDSDCMGSDFCCRPNASQPRQCLSRDFCLTQRAPVECEETAECAAGQVCSRCSRGTRECVPADLPDDPNNALGCVPDFCTQTSECMSPRVCCQLNEVNTCSVPSECDSPPTANPICSPSDPSPCPDPVSQTCCFVPQLNQFRCLINVDSCSFDACFGDPDCPSNQQCCGFNPQAGTAGVCQFDCDSAIPTCMQDGDCANDGFCCKLPGYSVGRCLPDDTGCVYQTCTTDGMCGSGLECCTEPPLSEGVCVPQGDCPPDP